MLICEYIKVLQRDCFSADATEFEGLSVVRNEMLELVSSKRATMVKKIEESEAEKVGTGRVQSRTTIRLRKEHQDIFADF